MADFSLVPVYLARIMSAVYGEEVRSAIHDSVKVIYDKQTENEEKLDECFRFVSNGKKKVAAAITDKGVQTAATASFEKLASSIRRIPSGDAKNTVQALTIGRSFVPERIITEW